MNTREVTLKVDGLKIESRFYVPDGTGQIPYPTVCICHGIPSGQPANPADGGYPLLAEKICHQGFAVFIFSFRGTGNSGGNLDMLGWARDLKAAVDYLCALPEVDRERLFLLGFSGGAAVSLYLAADDNRISGVAACASPAEFGFVDPLPLIDRFRSIGVFRDEGFPSSAAEWLNGFRLVSPLDHIARIAPRPVLLVYGSHDEVVPVGHAYRLLSRAREPKHLIIVDGAGHRLRQNDRAMGIVLDWLKSQC